MLPAHHGWLAGFFYLFLRFGAPGLVLFAALDSSFLTLPFANDLAVILLTSLHHGRFMLYAGAATVGSLAGCWVMFWLGHAGGESFIRANMSAQRFERMQQQVNRKGPILLAVPALIPPPFPFTAWVLAAGALEVPARRFLATLTAMRLLRFTAEAIAAIYVGNKMVRWMQTPSFRYFIEALMVVAIAASAYSVFMLVRNTRRGRRPTAGQPAQAGTK